VQQTERVSIDWGPPPSNSGRRGYLVAMVVAIILTLAGIAYLAVEDDTSGEREMPGMDMGDMDM
jgi:hypothetical protein